MRYCNHDLDQYDDWRLALSRSEVYVSISNELPDGHLHDAYTEVWPFSPKLAEPDTNG